MGMSELLRTANDTSVSEPWPRVHAFNVLRLAFKDKNLSTDSSGFFAEGTPSLPHKLCDFHQLKMQSQTLSDEHYMLFNH